MISKPIGNDSLFCIEPLGASPLGNGDIHDSFIVDGHGNVLDGHTTVRLPGGQSARLDW